MSAYKMKGIGKRERKQKGVNYEGQGGEREQVVGATNLSLVQKRAMRV